MNDTISIRALRCKISEMKQQSTPESPEATSLETQAQQKRQNAQVQVLCVEALESLIPDAAVEDNVYPFGASDKTRSSADKRGKAPQRYRNEGPTINLIRILLRKPGIAEEEVVTLLKAKGVKRDTTKKLMRRMLENSDARLENGHMHFTEAGQRTWEASPLSKAA